jgi:phytoene synthase
VSDLTARAIDLSYATLARGSKSFALAAHLLPKPTRSRAAVLYAWCRRTDDAIDLAPVDQQAAALSRLEDELTSIYQSVRPTDTTLAAFQAVVRGQGIPESYPRELLAGMAMDVAQRRYASMDELLHYCYRVAGTVGLMMCHVLGVRAAWALRHAAHLGMAMQLTNVARDVHEDWQRGRLYVPRELLREVGADWLADELGGPLPQRARAPLAKALVRLLGLADQLYRSGDAGVVALDIRAALSVRAAGLIYAAIGEKLKERDYDVFAERAVVAWTRKVTLVKEAALFGLGEVPARLRQPFRPALLDLVLEYPTDILPL